MDFRKGFWYGERGWVSGAVNVGCGRSGVSIWRTVWTNFAIDVFVQVSWRLLWCKFWFFETKYIYLYV